MPEMTPEEIAEAEVKFPLREALNAGVSAEAAKGDLDPLPREMILKEIAEAKREAEAWASLDKLSRDYKVSKDVREMIHVKGNISQSQIQEVQTYLANKWGIDIASNKERSRHD